MNDQELVADAVKKLADLKRQDPCIQRGRSGELISSFKIFWDSKPDEETFCKVCDGLLFIPRMIYYMDANPVWKSGISVVLDTPPPPPTPAPMMEAIKQGKGGKRR
jgi:hypothetical protein